MKTLKTFALIFAGLFSSHLLTAQVVNNSFENWSTHTEYFTGFNFFPADTFSYSEPITWTTSNALSSADTFGGRLNVIQSADANTGLSALRLTSDVSDTVATPLGPRIFTWPGIALNGDFPYAIPSDVLLLGGLVTPTMFVGAGQPFTQRLATIKGFYKYTPVFNDSTQAMDSCMVWAVLKRGTEEVAHAIFSSNVTTGGYAPFSAPFNYVSCSFPDTLIIMVSSSVPNLGSLLLGTTRLVTGSVLLVDDLSYDTLISNPNLPPIARPDQHSVIVNNADSIPVKQNDEDCDNPLNSLTIAITTAPVNGTASVSGDFIVYTPATNYMGTDSFYYTLSDGTNVSPPAIVRVQVGTIPVANFTWSFPLLPYQAHFLDQSINLPSTWFWDFGDGSGSTQRNPTHTFSVNAFYNVCLTASNTFGQSSRVCKTVTITGAGIYSVTLSDTSQTVCNGSMVTLDPIVNNGIAPYTYYWSSTGDPLSCSVCRYPSAVITQNSIYSVTAVDSYGSSATASVDYIVTGITNSMSLSVTNTHIDCLNPMDTTIVTVSNGVSPYVFNWGNGVAVSGTSPAEGTYTQAGAYVISVKDASNCVASVIDTILNNGVLLTTLEEIHPACIDMSTGKIKVSASGGTPPYNYLWSNGTSQDSIINVVAGVFALTVTDATSCSTTASFNLSPENGWGYYVYLNPSQTNCNNSGAIAATVSRGIPPFSFIWSNGSTTQNLTNLSGGIYSVTVTDSLGCQATGHAAVPALCYSIISGVAFNDTNNNCLLDAGETLMQNVYVTAVSNGLTYYGYTNAIGEYSIQVPISGTFTMNARNSYNYNTCGNLPLCGNPNHNITINTLGDTSANNNFGFAGISGFDLDLFARWTSGNPGFLKDYTIFPYNNSPLPFTGVATVTFTYDSNLIYQNSIPGAVHSLTNHTLTWLVDSIQRLGSNGLLSSFLVPVGLSLSTILQSEFYITPVSGDCDSSNNQLRTTQIVTGSYDPNEKIVEPAGKIVEEDSILTYTIGFQNTGTDSTHFIILKDTLSPHLDPASVRNIASSHPYSDFYISGEGILTWEFNPLRLVDSFTNEAGSHGFVMFTIKKKRNLAIGSIISNKASIYFDYNEPVVTNTVADTMSLPTYIFDVRGDDGISVKAFPNPFSGATSIVVEGLQEEFTFELYDVIGRLKRQIAYIATTRFELQRDNLSSAIYFYRITTAKGKGAYGKLVVE